MPDSMETSYNQWIGRKQTSLRRPTLDCGCRNAGEVSYHLWCDRLACQEHADALHDCGLFKGKSESGIEEEAVEPQAVVEAAALPPRQPFTLDPESHRALYGPAEAIRHAHPLLPVRLAETWQCPHCDFSTFIGGLKRLHEVACPAPLVDELEAPDPIGAQVTVMTEAEAAGFRAQQQLSLECSRSRPLCSGCDGGAIDGFTCMHDCHFTSDEAVLLARQGRSRAARRRAEQAEVSAPPVDAALEPDLDEPWQHIYTGSGRWHLVGMGDRAREVPCDCPKPAPWWRRMLPGGTR